MIELTRNQKIGFGVGAVVTLAIAIVVIYFVFIKKDTPKTEPSLNPTTRSPATPSATIPSTPSPTTPSPTTPSPTTPSATTSSSDEIDKAGQEALTDANIKRVAVTTSGLAFNLLVQRIKNEGKIPFNYNPFGELNQIFEQAKFAVNHEKLALLSVQAQTKLSSYTKYFDPKIAEEVTALYYTAKFVSTMWKTTWILTSNTFITSNNIQDSNVVRMHNERTKIGKEQLGISP